ncbi:hypothetical protein P7C73_g398, partial [Tremellales sp. Uapishka_1]
MAGILSGLECMVGAGVKGLLDIADGLYRPEGEKNEHGENGSEATIPPPKPSQPLAIDAPHPPTSSSSTSPSQSSTASKPAATRQDLLIKTVDVPSGWIHLQSTYLDGAIGGSKKIRSFGLKNLVDGPVEVAIASDLGENVVFWTGDDEKSTTTLSLTLLPLSTTTLFLAFHPSQSDDPTPSPDMSEGGFTPRILSRTQSSEQSFLPTKAKIPSEPSSISGASSSSMSNQKTSGGSRRLEPIHRAFSVHGSISFQATTASDPTDDLLTPSFQSLNLPFFATVCRSLFTASIIDPITNLASGSQLSSGQLTLDFGSDSVVGGESHRDILLVNRSEIELEWSTAVVSSRFKDQVWLSLRDLDSENVFGVDRTAQPVALPALSSRHLRLELRVKAPVTDFDFDFVISNINQSGNIVTCKAIGSTQATTTDNSLKVLSGNHVDFGQICDGLWAKKVITCKNSGDKPLDVQFSASAGVDVVFRLAGVAGEDIDEDVPVEIRRSGKMEKRSTENVLARTSTRDRGREVSHSLKSPRVGSPSSTGRGEEPQLVTPASSDLARMVRSNDDATSSAVLSSDVSSEVDHSLTSSRPQSRASTRLLADLASVESDDEEEAPFFSGGVDASPKSPTPISDTFAKQEEIPNQIEELTMRPGTEYRVFVLYRPARDLVSPPSVAGALRESQFKVYLDSLPVSTRSSVPRSRRTLNCSAESCTSLIEISSGNTIDYGEVTVGASKSSTLTIKNLSALSARVEIAAISKVLSANRNVVVIPPGESVEERMEFFPRRINDRYEKQVFVRNLLNRMNDQLVEIRSKNVDVYNVTLHSHLYRILTPSGSNFLDFGSVVISSPTVRTIQIDNLSHSQLILELSSSQPEDIELFVKLEDAPHSPVKPARITELPERIASPQNGELKERFMETLAEMRDPGKMVKGKSKARDRSVVRGNGDGEVPKPSIGASVAAALKKGGRGRPVQLYGNAVVFKDRTLLEDHEYLDLASGPPIAAHRASPRSKKTHLLDSIELEDKSKLSGQHPKIPKLDFAASAKATGLFSKDAKPKKTKPPTSPRLDDMPPLPSLQALISSITNKASSPELGTKSPALTAKRAEPKSEMFNASDISKMSVDELLIAVEQHDARRASITHSTPEEEEQFVRRTISLRKELTNLVSAGKLISAKTLSVPSQSSRQLIVIMTPNGDIRPTVTTRPKRADSKIFIKLLEFDRTLLSLGGNSDLPVRDLIIRSSCVRSVLEVQQSSINFGNCEKGEEKSKTIVIHNKSDCIGIFRMKTSGSIASGNLKLGLGRYGVISAFGRKQVESFSFTPSLVGNYQETIVLQNVLDSANDQNVSVKAAVRKQPSFTIDTALLDFGTFVPDEKWPSDFEFLITNVSKHERTFLVEVAAVEAFAEISLTRDEKDAGTALSKVEEEELEGLLQKLKIARRKGKSEKIVKYENRLLELGVSQTETQSVEDEPSEAADAAATTPPSIPKACVPLLSITLQPNQKHKIIVELLPKTAEYGELKTTIKVFDRKNTDETISIEVRAAAQAVQSASPTMSATSASTSIDPLHVALMRHCLGLTLECPVSPTAFCVGSTIFLPSSSNFYPILAPYFPAFDTAAGLILGDGYSRQIPGNTHAEANALTNLRTHISVLQTEHEGLPSAEDILRESECFATMEPCSIRTSGGPSCALELVRAKVATVYLGVEEPPDFVQCEGVRILMDGGVVVKRVVGLEEACLQAARRGRG